MQTKKVLLIMLLLSSYACADGGAPLMLIFNPIMFFVSLFVIVLIEGLFIQRAIRMGLKYCMAISLKVNALSTLVIGIGLPVLVVLFGTIVGLIFSKIGLNAELPTSLIATWIYDSDSAILYAKQGIVIWLVISFICTIIYEARLIHKYSESRLDIEKSKSISIKMNIATYLILAAEMAIMIYRI